MPRTLVEDPAADAWVLQWFDGGRSLLLGRGTLGRNEVYVVPMPRPGAGADTTAGDAPGGRWQVSIDGGIQPRWGRDGRELFYRRPDDTIVAATVQSEGAGFRVLQQRPLFQAFQRGLVASSSVAPDGERFLISAARAEHMAPLVVVTGWHRTLRGSE